MTVRMKLALQPVHLVALLFQGAVVVSGGFITFLWLLSVYAPTTVLGA